MKILREDYSIDLDTPLEKALDRSLSYEERLTRAIRVKGELSSLWDVETCPAQYLPYLAWTYNVPVWREDWDEQKQRSFLRQWRTARRKAGTPWAIRTMLYSIGIDRLSLIPLPDEPYTFLLVLRRDYASDQKKRDEVFDIVYALKSQRDRAIVTIGIEASDVVRPIAVGRVNKILRLGSAMDDKIVVTDAGRRALGEEIAAGRTLRITKIELYSSPARKVPSVDEIEGKIKEIPIQSLSPLSSGGFQVSIVDSSKDEYRLFSYGMITDKGVLFAFDSSVSESPLSVKTERERLVISVDTFFEDDGKESIEIVSAQNLDLSVSPEIAALSREIIRTRRQFLGIEL